MYACADVIYGWDLSGSNDSPIRFKNASGKIDTAELVEILESESPKAYISNYSGNGGEPRAIGISVHGFNSFGNFLVTKIPHEVTETQKENLEKVLSELSDEVKEYLAKMGEPQLFVLWSTS